MLKFVTGESNKRHRDDQADTEEQSADTSIIRRQPIANSLHSTPLDTREQFLTVEQQTHPETASRPQGRRLHACRQQHATANSGQQFGETGRRIGAMGRLHSCKRPQRRNHGISRHLQACIWLSVPAVASPSEPASAKITQKRSCRHNRIYTGCGVVMARQPVFPSLFLRNHPPTAPCRWV